MSRPGSFDGFAIQVMIVLRIVAPSDVLIEKVMLSQFGAEVPARGTSRVFASGCCRPIHRGIGPAFNTLSMERTNGCEKEEGCEEGRRQEEEVGAMLVNKKAGASRRLSCFRGLQE